MIRSMYSGVTGMKNHQIRMDTVSNNIANVNTTGYKSSRANFQDTLYQTMRTEGEGRNASQIGLGMQVGSISGNFTQGPMLYTGRTLDLGIDGEGFFTVKDPSGSEYYSRDGVFYLTNDGYLVTGDGYKVQYIVTDGTGKAVEEDSGKKDEDGNAIMKTKIRPIQISNGPVAELAIEPDGSIKGKNTQGEPLEFKDHSTDPVGTTDLQSIKISLATFDNKEGLKRTGKNLYSESTASGTPSYGNANSGGYGAINSGYLEGSNVELTEEFTNMITTQRGYQANARVITTSDHMLEELINLKR